MEAVAIVARVSQHQLHLGGGFDAAWQHVARPWFERAKSGSWRSREPWVVLVPSRSLASLLKQRLLAANIPLAAVRFYLPAEAREFLAQHYGGAGRVAIRETLHLLLSMVAAGHGDSPTARAIVRDPSRLMRTLDALEAAGQSSLAGNATVPPVAAAIADEFRDRLGKLGWTTAQRLDWQLLHRASSPTASREIRNLLVLGFDGLHWELWPLLNAAVHASENADIVLTQPRYKAEQIDQTWIGTWEQNFGAAEPFGDADLATRPFAALSERMENPQADVRDSACRADVLIGRNLREQSEAVVARAATWLAGGGVTRLGILVASSGPLAREISARLLECGICHFNAFGHAANTTRQVEAWRAWLEFQRDQKLGPLLAVIRDSNSEILDAVESAYTHLLADDPAAIVAWLGASPREDQQAAAKAISRVKVLPATATLAGFIAATRQAAALSGWHDLLPQLEQQFEAVREIHGEELSRPLFLDWLASVTAAVIRERDAHTTNPFAIVHLLASSHAEGQTWSHLILTDLNEGRWPPVFDQPGFLREEDVAALNREALTTGQQGEGHLTMVPDRALLLGPNERRALARRQFYNLVESPSAALALTAALENDEDSRGMGPSDFLSHLYFTQSGTPLTESRAAQIHSATLRWIEQARHTKPAPAKERSDHPSAAHGLREGQLIPTSQTRAAFDARRKADTTFGEYEFALLTPPSEPLVIACKEWETAIKSPAVVFLSRLLGVEMISDFLEGDRWPLTTGTWVHAWMSDSMGSRQPDRLSPRPDSETLLAQVRNASVRTRSFAERAYRAAKRPLPDWWLSGWARASWIAGELAGRIGGIEGWPFARTEWTLPKPTEIDCAGGVLRVRGRMDLVLSSDEVFVPGSRVWLFDFKTGGDQPLRPKDLAKKFGKGGGGLQLALYARALRAIGAGDVAITLLTPETEAVPQLSSGDVEALNDFWSALVRMQDTGIFGMRGALSSEFGHVETMPLATLAIDESVLEEKWVRTHPGLAVIDRAKAGGSA